MTVSPTPAAAHAPAPWMRATLFALVAVGFAVAAHTSAEGRLPALWLVALAVPAVAVTARPAAMLEQRGATLLAGLVALQLGLHAVFVTGAGQRSGGAAGWLCCGSSNAPALASTGPAAHTSLTLDRAAVVQLLLHLLAAVLLAMLLRVPERAAWAPVRAAAVRAATALTTVLRWVTRRLTAPTPADPPLRRRPVSAPARVRPAGLLVVRRQGRRGPPVAVLPTA